ncbi:MAG: hypothetical protein R3300_17445 [Candidatus Promineifilaceae bacterium]|nr:hypothetical protein [Candidatus Promineifilaceae bacterium]
MKPGFNFEQPVPAPGAGHCILNFCLTRQPTMRLFDACEVTFVSLHHRRLGRRTLTVDSTRSEDEGAARDKATLVVPGHVQVIARNGDVLNAYTMGGTLTLWTDEACLYGRLTSDAPIVPLNLEPDERAADLIYEWESLLGRKAAEWDVPADYIHERLAGVAAKTLYPAALRAVQRHLIRLAEAGELDPDSREQQVLHYVECLLQTLPAEAVPPPTLDDLIGPARAAPAPVSATSGA